MYGIDGIADVLMGRRSEMPYMKRKGDIMLYGWKAKRHLALYVSIALSCGGGYSFFASPHAYADEVTVDTGAPSPGLYGTNRYYGATSLSGASSGNKLIVKGSTMATGWFMGGWAQGASGDATNNTVEMTETAKVYSTGGGVFGVTGVYGGWSRGGNATNNTIVLSGEMSGYGDTILFGGHSETSGTDVTTGNMLWVKKEGNSAYSIFRFQKMKFSLASASPNDVMLKVNTNYGATQGFKWSDIEVENPSAWQNGAVGSKRVTLYQGPTIQLTNYDATSPVNGTSGDYEYGLTTNTTAAPGTSTVTATEIYFDRNKFKNSHVTYNDKTAQADDEKNGIYHTLPSATGVYSGAIYAGTSTLGNTTKDNVLTIDGMNIFGRTMYGGYTQSMTGDSTGNEVILRNISAPGGPGAFDVYGGWSKNGKATGNTITLEGSGGYSTGYGMYYYARLYGGYSGKTGATAADHTAGNTLKVTAKDSAAHTINNFEKMKFVLGDNVASGDTMLYVRSVGQDFDWTKIAVDNASTWRADKNGTQHVTLYKGPWVSLSNYGISPVNGTSDDYEYGMTTDTTTPTATTVGAYEIYFDRNKFQNSHVTYNDKTAQADDEKNGIYHTLPSATGVYSGAIYAGTSTLGNTTKNNVLTIDGMNIFGRTMYGGYTQSMTGDSTGNEVILRNIPAPGGSGAFDVYGGWSKNGKATSNTITLEGSGGYSTGYGMYYYASLHGGYSGKTGATTADNTAGNTLKVTAKASGAGSVENFENLKFVLGDNVASGDTMLYIRNSMQNFDWTKITVDNASTWGAGKNGTQHVTLYKGPWVSLSNYGTSPVNGTSGDYEYGMTTDTTTPTATTVGAYEIYFDRNKFRNSKITYTTDAPVAGEKNTFHTLPATTAPYSGALIAGVSIFDNTPTGNVLTVKGFAVDNRKLYGGYASSGTGDATGNEVVIDHTTSSGNYSYVYGGFSEKGNATGNTVTLAGGDNTNGTTWKNRYMYLYGGDGNPAAGSKDYKTGNVLQVKGSGNDANTINNFENMKFVLGAGIGSGDIMLSVYTYNAAQTFDWKKVTVSGISDWVNSLPAGTNAPTLTLYNGLGAPLTLTNYAPSLLGNAGDYEFGTFANGTLASGTMTNATQIKLAGNKFQNVTSPVVDAATTSVHGGYSSYGNTTNTNVITVNSGAYTNVRAGYTDAVKGGSDKNELTFTGTASATNLYGGYTTGTSASAVDLKADAAAKADAKGNTVNISGGTVNANGKIAGGYIAQNTTLATPAASAGNASGNTINITGGTFGGNTVIYGGYTEGTGKATGNTVNLKADSLALGGAFLYGGGSSGSSSDVASDNTLNVAGKDITVRGVANFAKMNFDVSNRTAGDTLLKVTGGATGGLDWAGVEVTPKDFAFTPKTYEKRLFTLMENAAGISFMQGTTNTYNPIGAKERTNGDFEYVIDTDNHTVNAAKYVYVDGFRFKNNQAAKFETADGTKDAAWAGRTAAGNKVEKNTLTVTGGSLKNAYGGLVENTKRDKTTGQPLTTGDADGNTLILKKDGANPAPTISGTGAGNAYGAEVRTKDGNATNNKALLSAGSVAGSVYGGAVTATGATGKATGNSVTITGDATVGGDVYGGFAAGTGATTGNTVNLGDGTAAGKITLAAGTASVTGTVYGGSGATFTNNVLNVNGNATVGNILHFDKVNFNYDSSTTNAASPMLTLSGGAATDFDWKKFAYNGSAPTSGRLVLMQNAANINVANYTGAKELAGGGDTSEATIDTNNSSATATQIILGGYTFKGATASLNAGSATEDVWAGRSVIGNTTTGNTLTVNGATHRDAYGGWTAGTGTSKALKNNSTGNTVNLAGGTVRNIYGGFTSSDGGSATGNKVNISGGSIAPAAGVGGTVYGGFVSHAGAGDATGNTVTITGGSMKDVYAGFTNGTGKTTGNTVNLGDGTNAMASGTSITGTLAGGNQATATDNTLNVNTNAAVGNIKNFAKISFKLDGAVNASDALLKLTGGATTGLDWAGVDVTPANYTFTPKTYEKRLFTLMENAAGISFMKNGDNTYSPLGAKERTSGGKYEYVIDTDNHSVNATRYVYVDGFRFKDNQAAYTAADGSHTEAWAGRTAVGNKVEGNALKVEGGTLTAAAYGGLVENNKLTAGGQPLTTGDAEKNTLTVTGGSVADGYGAKVTTKDGAAKTNTAEISSGTVTGSLYGGAITAAGATKDATGNKVNLTGGAVTGSVYGGALTGAGATGNATGNTVTLMGAATVGGNVYAGYTQGTGATTGNTVNLGDKTGTFTGSVTGTVVGGSNANNVTGNTLNINTNANVGNIKNFEKLVFDLNSTVNTANAMLNLTGGAVTGSLDWRKLEVNTDSLTGAGIKTYEPYRVKLMENTSGISFQKGTDNTYTLGGGTKSAVTEKLEYVIDTNNSLGTGATSVSMEGYQFKGNTAAAYVAADGTHTEAWSGRTKIGNKVEGNTLTVSGGSLTAAAYGGLVENTKRNITTGQLLTTGSAAENTLKLAGGSIKDGYGADVRTKEGGAEKNIVTVSAGTATGNVYGAALTAAGAKGQATGNTVTIAGGAVTGDVHGAALTQADAAGEATKNIVNISAGTVGGTVYGAKNAGTGAATGSTITITGGTLHDVYGGHAASGATTGNTVSLGTADTPAGAAGTPVAAGTSIGNIYGGNQASVTGNVLNVYDSVTAANVDKFEKVNFNVTSNVAAGDTLLTLTNGAASHIDWNKMALNNLNALVPSNTTGHLLTLVNSTGNVTFDNYAGTGAIERKKDGDYEYVIDTDSHSGTAKKVDVTGYRFRNNTNATYASGTDAEVWAGRTKVGNTVTKNKLTVTGGTPTAVYGGIAENFEHVTGGTEKPTGDATENTLVLSNGASVTKAYGADVRTLSGNATKNVVTLAGGTVTGSLYGGALTKAGATGSAMGNTVTITGGTVGGDVYAGYTSGTGKTTDNTVSLGDGTNAVAAGTTVTGVIYGGSSAADTTGNVLNVNAKGVTAGSVANFAKIRFQIDSNVADGDDVLTLTQNTTLAHGSIEEPTPAVISGWLGNTMEKTAHLIKMNGSTLNLTGYTPGSSRSRRGDVEYAYKTDNDAISTTGSLDLFAYKWQNAGVEINSNAHADVFGGKSTLGTTGETLKNKLTLKTGASVTNAVAGDTQTASGTAEENTLTIEAGTATNAVGGKTLAGKASGNTAEAAGGNVMNLKGAQSTSGLVQENHAKITAGTVDTAVGAESTNGAAAGNDVTITGGTVTNAMGAHTLAGDAAENHAVISGGTVTGSLKGAQSVGKAVKNTVEVKGGNLSGASVMGAEAVGDAEKNSVTISAATTANAIVGAVSTAGNAEHNTVNITADVTGNIMGAQASGVASQNVINIENATVTGTVTGGSGAVTADNVINLKGATVNGDVVGGTAGDTGNTLAVRYSAARPTSHINDFSNIKRLHFYLGGEVDSNTPTLLQLDASTKDITNLDVGVGVSGRANRLTVGDTISLMKVAPGGTLTMGTPTQDNKTTGMQGVSLLYEFSLTNRSTDELVAKVLKVAVNEKNKSFAETRAAATDFINRGADLLAGAGISSARKEAAGDKMDGKMHGYHIWAAMSQGTMRAETGSYADTKGYNLSLGWAKEQNVKAGKLLFTPFVEYGRGSYDSYLDDGTHGSGKISYLGGGVMGRIEKANGIWAEAALHAGRAQSDYAGSIFAGTTSRYDGSSGYYAAHFGIGKMRKIGTSDGLNTYLRYFYSKQDGMSTQLNTGEDYDFGAVASHRLRLGFTYSHRENAGKELYAGLAYEYEFDGTATASYQGFNAPSPSLTGGSVMVELGYRFAPKGSRVSYDLHMTGWQGKRRGMTGGAQVNWAF